MKAILKNTVFQEMLVIFLYFILILLQKYYFTFLFLINMILFSFVISVIVYFMIRNRFFLKSIFLSILLLYCKSMYIVSAIFVSNDYPGKYYMVGTVSVCSLLFFLLNFLLSKNIKGQNYMLFFYSVIFDFLCFFPYITK
jgi:hypothetical protein